MFDEDKVGGTLLTKKKYTHIVAVGTIGCKRSKLAFMRGYNEMLKRIKPRAIICYGSPFEEMEGSIIPIDYNSTRRVNRNGR